jgi:threonine/homoserine/homoserine lactone efflux protein
MIQLETATVFFAASVALGLAPGPDNIFVLTQSALHGRVAGLLITAGLCTGLLVHTTAVAVGVAAIFATSVIAFNVVKILGAGYLLYLAWGAFRTQPSGVPNNNDSDIGLGHLYARGMVMNISNPKVAIFFLAFLPQFADPSRGSLTLQLFMLGAIFIVATIIVFGSIALFAGTVGNLIKKSPRVQIVMSRIAGIIFVGLALSLLSAER